MKKPGKVRRTNKAILSSIAHSTLAGIAVVSLHLGATAIVNHEFTGFISIRIPNLFEMAIQKENPTICKP